MDVIETVAAVEQRSKSNTRRIDKLEQSQDALQNLALSVRELATQMRSMQQTQSDTVARLTDLERRPGDRWEKIVQAACTVSASGIIGALLALILR